MTMMMMMTILLMNRMEILKDDENYDVEKMILWWWCWRFYDVGAAKEEDGVLFRCNCIVHAHQRSAHFLPTQNAQINQQPAIAQLWNHSLFSKWFRHRLFSARRKEKPAASNRNQWRKRQKNKSMKRKLPIRWKKSIRKKKQNPVLNLSAPLLRVLLLSALFVRNIFGSSCSSSFSSPARPNFECIARKKMFIPGWKKG